jgi:NhaB family Na+:H+ antiporter
MWRTVGASFLGGSPVSYKICLLAALTGNVLLRWLAGPTVAGWAILGEFIATLALALRCYPLAPGGLLAIEAVVLGLTSPDHVYAEVHHGFPIILLLVFMVSAIGLMRQLLVLVFSRVLTALSSPTALALTFCLTAALLSAFLDALTVIAVVITVSTSFYRLYFLAASGLKEANDRALGDDAAVPGAQREQLARFRNALRSLLMHAAIGSALGGVATLIGEPQNLLIGHTMGWSFARFAREMAPASLPVLATGLVTCAVVERLRLFGFGSAIPGEVRALLLTVERRAAAERTPRETWTLIAQALAAGLLIAALALHWAEVGLIGLAVVVIVTALLGVTEEHELGEAMKTAIPFTALLVIFFAIVSVISDQGLFRPVIELVLARKGRSQLAVLYLVNGALSAISDNVFVATAYMNELKHAFDAGAIPPAQYTRLAVAVNVGTNIPSVATPNGQAAFLFLLTSGLAPLLRLSYGRMAWMALPYFVTMSTVGLLAVTFLLA